MGSHFEIRQQTQAALRWEDVESLCHNTPIVVEHDAPWHPHNLRANITNTHASLTSGPIEVAPNFRTLQVLGLAVRLQHQGVCRGEEIDSQEAWCASFVR